MRKLLTLLILVCCPPSMAAEFDPPLTQIRVDAGLKCAVEALEATVILIGNNGFRVERWEVETCAGRVTYEVSYYPPQFFRDRVSPYSVRRIEKPPGGPA